MSIAYKDTVRAKTIAEYERRGAERFKNHVLTDLGSNGLYGCWRCGTPDGSGIDSFRITTIPGVLIITGDIGDLILERTENMIAWCAGSINSIDYFEEKVPRAIKTKEYDQDIALEWIEEQLENEDECYDGEELEHLEALKDYTEDEYCFYQEFHQSGVNDGNDFPDFENYDNNFLSCREAIRCFLRLMGYKLKGEPTP